MSGTINPLDHPVCLETPRRLGHSAWIEHIPFAFWLTSVLKPRVLVELGVHHGVSFCAFCQAVGNLSLDTRTFGVDTWAGDPHAGNYSEPVFQDLQAHHGAHYARFSSLLRMDFDQAANLFSAGQIDLLHIDGYHTYEAARHDFETWLPKMSQHGVILFHDVTERQTDFGVWKVWEELTARYPSFTFGHEHGLGVLAVGTELPSAVRTLVSTQGAPADQLRAFFEQLGQRIRFGMELQTAQQHLVRQQQLLTEQDQMQAELGRLQTIVTHQQQHIHHVEAEHQRLIQAEADLTRQLEQTRREQAELESSTAWRLSHRLSRLSKTVAPVGTKRRALLVPGSHAVDQGHG